MAAPFGSVLVVEDEPAVQELIAVHLERAGYRVLRSGNVTEARALVRQAVPDLVLLDLMLPGASGLSFARELRSERRTREVPIIVVTARGEEQDKVAGLEAGADDYLTKPFSPRELLARIKAVLRRRAPQLTSDAVEVSGLKLDPVARRVTANGREVRLGPTEFRLLHFLITHPERVYNRARLLDEVWGDHVFVGERTVDVHIRRLRRALEPSGLARLIETVRGAGYRFRSDSRAPD